ncbi:MAG: GvpL/GvpF family gas vesicle protein, partial [Streptomyces sp.]
EWAVKVNLLAAPAPAAEPARNPGPGADGSPAPSGRAYLARLRTRGQEREQRRERAVEAAELLDRAVLSIADATLRRRPHGAEITGRDRTQIMNSAYLVPDERRSELLELLDRLRAAPEFQGCEVEASGPWVPYSFVEAGAFTEVAGGSGDQSVPAEGSPRGQAPHDSVGSRA